MGSDLSRTELSRTLSGRRTLVTGGAGFLGRHVVEQLRQAGVSEPIVPRRRDTDLTDPAAVARLFADARPEVVIHLAAEVGGIGANRRSPGRFFYANMAMGLHVIEQARLSGVRKLVLVGTVCSYPKHTPVPFRETELWNGYPEETNAPYGVAKKALLTMLGAYREQYDLRGIGLLPVNLYGPGDEFEPERSHVIPALIRKCVEAREAGRERIVCWGTGSASREFLYVEDCAEAIVRATALYEGAEPVNVGSGQETTIRALVERIADLTRFEGRIDWDASQPDGQPRRCLDVSGARERFGFTARTPLEEGLRKTVEWYEERVLGGG
jgi:GDP-L-fucose synthase